MPASTAPIQFLAPPARRPQHSGGDAGPGPLSHAVRISFGDAGEAARAADRFEAAASSYWPGEAAGKRRLWREDVAAPSTGAKAVRRRSIELSRAIGSGVRPPVRGVLLRYRDGRADATKERGAHRRSRRRYRSSVVAVGGTAAARAARPAPGGFDRRPVSRFRSPLR